jgi:hypothetical protein
MQFETRVREIFTPGRSQRRGSALARQSKSTAIGARTSSDMLSLPRRAIQCEFHGRERSFESQVGVAGDERG